MTTTTTCFFGRHMFLVTVVYILYTHWDCKWSSCLTNEDCLVTWELCAVQSTYICIYIYIQYHYRSFRRKNFWNERYGLTAISTLQTIQTPQNSKNTQTVNVDVDVTAVTSAWCPHPICPNLPRHRVLKHRWAPKWRLRLDETSPWWR